MPADKSYIDARLEALERRTDDLLAFTQRMQDQAQDALNDRLAAMDHERELMREDVRGRASRVEVERNVQRIDKLEAAQARIAGALALVVILLGLLPLMLRLFSG